jgi:hypothetical protein
VIPPAGSHDEFSRAVERGHRIVCFSSDLHMLQAAGAEHAETCLKVLGSGRPG